jgi:hypothetical protein
MAGQHGFKHKNEYRLRISVLDKPIAYIDHVWLKEVPYPRGASKDVPVVAFEITKDLSTLWTTKKMKGDIENLRLCSAALGVLIIPTIDTLKTQAEKLGSGASTWLKNLTRYIESLKKIASPLTLEIWYF